MLELILGIVFLIYILFIGQLIYGCNRMKRFSRKEFTPKTSFTIVVPFRNEKENLPNLLHSISLLHYPKELVEVILVDDDSEDEFRIQNLEFRMCNILYLSSFLSIIAKISLSSSAEIFSSSAKKETRFLYELSK